MNPVQAIQNTEVEQDKDGGYFAIKGFLYQFDKTIIEILKNPDSPVLIEQKQDIQCNDYIIQVKHKETQTYTDSKIKKAIIQLINMFKEDQTQKFCLYCHFKDMPEQRKLLKLSEIENILGSNRSEYTQLLKKSFIKNFVIEFANDYELQFASVIKLIMTSYEPVSKEMAIYYYSIIRSNLFDLAINRQRQSREISKSTLDDYIRSTSKIVFYSAYSNYLSDDKYEKLVRNQFIINKSMNSRNYERLIIIDIDRYTNQMDVFKILAAVIGRFYKSDKSPSPYVCLRNVDKSDLNLIKQGLLDGDLNFNDGTRFDGDKFRVDYLTKKQSNLSLKLIDEKNIPQLLGNLTLHELYEFFINDSYSDENDIAKHIQIQIKETKQVLNIL